MQLKKRIQLLKFATMGSNGFSLIEILVASAMASMIMVMAYAAHRTISLSLARIADQAEFYEIVNNAITTIDKDITNTYFRRDNKKIHFISEMEGENSILNFVTILHNEYAISGNIKKSVPLSDVREVGYYIKSDPEERDTNLLIRREDFHYDDDPEKGGMDNVLLKGVTGLTFEFKMGNSWTSRWDSRQNNRIPKAIKTTINIKDYQGKEHRITFLTMINIR